MKKEKNGLVVSSAFREVGGWREIENSERKKREQTLLTEWTVKAAKE